MALFHLKGPVNARMNPSNAVAIETERLPKLGSGDLGGDWGDWITAHVLMREARSLIEASSKAGREMKAAVSLDAQIESP